MSGRLLIRFLGLGHEKCLKEKQLYSRHCKDSPSKSLECIVIVFCQMDENFICRHVPPQESVLQYYLNQTLQRLKYVFVYFDV